MVSTRSTSRSISSSPEPIYSHAALRDSSSHRHGHRHSSDRLSKTRITSMLLYDEREANDLRRMLLSVTEQLKQESQRADDNERRAREAIQRFKAINEARVTAQQDASRANEELRLYKLQLEYAQKEIFKAQEILDSLEAQRHDAETSAAKARSIARKLKEESLMDLAREEGRRIGLQEGLARGRRLVFEQARSTSDHRDSGVILPSELSLADDHDHEADLRSFHRTRTPAVVEPPLDPIGEPMLSFPPSPPAVNSPNPEASPRPQVARPPSGDFKPIVVRDTPSPSHHSDNIIPQDGFIPRADNDSTIRLPPPHGMVRPIAPASSSPRPDRPVSIDGEPLMVPNPGTRLDFVPIMEPESPGSTTISQFELVSEPNGSVSRPSRKKRTSLSVIPETVSGGNTPADHVRSISADPVSRPASSASIPHGQSSVLSSSSTPADFGHTNVVDSPSSYVYRRPSYASTSSSSVNIADKTPMGSTRSLNRMTSSSSVPDITIQPPSRPQSQTPQATPFVSHRAFLSAEDAANRPMSPSTSTPALDTPSSPVTPHNSSVATPAGGTVPAIITLADGQLPPGFVPMSVSSSQAPPSRTVPVAPYGTPATPPNGAVASPKLSAHMDSRPLYGVPVPDASTSSGRRSLHNPVRIPVSSTTADSSAMVPPASLFSLPNEPSSSETDEDDAVRSSLASSNDTLSTPPPSRKKPKAKSKRPTYDTAPTPPGQEYPSTPLLRAGALAPSGSSATSAIHMHSGSAGMTPAARHRKLRQ